MTNSACRITIDVLQKGIKKNSEWEEPVLQFCCDTKTNKGGYLIRYEQDNTRHAFSSITVELCGEKRSNKRCNISMTNLNKQKFKYICHKQVM